MNLNDLKARKVYYLMSTLIGLSIVALVGCVYVSDTMLKKQAGKVESSQVKAAAQDRKQQQLSKARSDLNKYSELGKIAKNIVPQDKDQAQTVREISAMADEHGIKLGGITFPTSSLGSTAKTPVKPGLSQLTAIPNIPGVYSLDITIQSDSASPAPFSKFIAFLDEIEHNRRTALIKSVSVQPDAKDPSNVSFTLTVSESIKP